MFRPTNEHYTVNTCQWSCQTKDKKKNNWIESLSGGAGSACNGAVRLTRGRDIVGLTGEGSRHSSPLCCWRAMSIVLLQGVLINTNFPSRTRSAQFSRELPGPGGFVTMLKQHSATMPLPATSQCEKQTNKQTNTSKEQRLFICSPKT